MNRQVTLLEVEEAVKEMASGKALGPDGFTIYFFKDCWDLVKLDVWAVFEDSKRSSSILKSLNSTLMIRVFLPGDIAHSTSA